MTKDEIRIIKKLMGCRFLPGAWEKRFIRTLYGYPDSAELSAEQAHTLRCIEYRYRKQIYIIAIYENMQKPDNYIYDRKDDAIVSASDKEKLDRWKKSVTG